MSNIPRWLIVTLLVAFVLGLIVWARGPEHHRGEDVGAARSLHAVSWTFAG